MLTCLFLFKPLGTSLSVQILAPSKVKTIVEKNILTAPGRPGSVDKGEREERGMRLAISTGEKITKAKLVTELTIQNK